MKFFLDRNLSKRLVTILESVGIEAVHHDSIFNQTTGDDEIIKYVAQNNLALVTYDRKMLRAHKIALREHFPYVVFLTASIGEKTVVDQVRWYMNTGASAFQRLRPPPPNVYVTITLMGEIRHLPATYLIRTETAEQGSEGSEHCDSSED